MRISKRSVILGVLVAFGATTVHAQPEAPSAASPTTTSPALDLALPPMAITDTPASDLAAPVAVSLPTTVADPLQSASPEVQRVVRWIRDSHDNANMPYLLVDKVNAQVLVFDGTGQFKATAPALLGMGTGDRLLVANNTPMSAMSPDKRITPAGRYLSRLAIDSHGKELLVIDYDASISLHPVVKGTPAEHRAERLASATAQDNRISFGCINVPVPFYSNTVSPTFANKMGVVYILPETSPANVLFGFQPFDAPTPVTQQVSSASSGPAAQAANPGAK
jgi:hypothetical protein